MRVFKPKFWKILETCKYLKFYQNQQIENTRKSRKYLKKIKSIEEF